MTPRSGICLLALLAVMVLGACTLDRGPAPGRVVPATPIPTFTPTPRPAPLVPISTPTPIPTPAVATGEQARLRVWLAIYGCFDQLPVGSFAAYQDRPQRWIVEGRREITEADGVKRTISYGLWVVDAATGDISPYDQQATLLAANNCFRRP